MLAKCALSSMESNWNQRLKDHILHKLSSQFLLGLTMVPSLGRRLISRLSVMKIENFCFCSLAKRVTTWHFVMSEKSMDWLLPS